MGGHHDIVVIGYMNLLHVHLDKSCIPNVAFSLFLTQQLKSQSQSWLRTAETSDTLPQEISRLCVLLIGLKQNWKFLVQVQLDPSVTPNMTEIQAVS